MLASLIGPTVASADSPAVYWGAYINGAPFDPAVMDKFEADAGKKESIVHWGQPWQMNGSMQPFQTQSLRNRPLARLHPDGQLELLESRQSVHDPNYTLAKVYNGHLRLVHHPVGAGC